MRKWLIILGILILVVLVVLVVAWRMPASVVLAPAQSKLPPEVKWSETTGTAWNGQMQDFTWKDLKLGTVEWKFDGFEDIESRSTRWNVHGYSPQYEVRALVTLTGGGDIRQVQNVQGHLPASWIDISDKLPLLYLDGTVELDLKNLELDNDLPVNGSGRVTWSNAAVTGGASERFGTLQLDLEPRSNQAPAGMAFKLRSTEPADVRVEGHGSVLRNDYDIDLELNVSPARRDLEQFLQQIGTESAPGQYRFSWEGNIR
jgi:general secretion pathway protein N